MRTMTTVTLKTKNSSSFQTVTIQGVVSKKFCWNGKGLEKAEQIVTTFALHELVSNET